MNRRHSNLVISQPPRPPDTRLFRRKDEGYMSGSRSRALRRGKGSNSKERSSSTSRLLEG